MNHDPRHRLEDVLGRELAVAQNLAEALAAERSALTGISSEAVKEKAAEKIRLFADIEELEGERRALWGASATDGSAFGTIVAGRWRKLMEVMAGCRDANNVNGHIIHIRQNQIRQLFDIVRGGPPMLYGPQGKTFARALRALAQA